MYCQHFSTVSNVIHEQIAVEIVGNFSCNFLRKKYIIFHMNYFKNFCWDMLTAVEKVNAKPVCA